MGKAIGAVEGNSFDNFVTDLTPSQIEAFFDADDPHGWPSRTSRHRDHPHLYDLERSPDVRRNDRARNPRQRPAPGEREQGAAALRLFRRIRPRGPDEGPGGAGPADLDDRPRRVADPRWVGTGGKIYNNKGKPVRQYEPFFSASPHFGIETWGVSPIAVLRSGRARRRHAASRTTPYEKVVFDPWQQSHFDANDTVTFDPKTDPDVGEYFSRLPDSDYLPTWYQQRIDGAAGPHERAAADQGGADADTPTVAHFDTLGRTVSECRRQWRTGGKLSPHRAPCSTSRAINAR